MRKSILLVGRSRNAAVTLKIKSRRDPQPWLSCIVSGLRWNGSLRRRFSVHNPFGSSAPAPSPSPPHVLRSTSRQPRTLPSAPLTVLQTAPPPRSRLAHFFASGNLPRPQEGLDQRALAANNHPGKTFEPPAIWNFRLRIQPISKFFELISGNGPFTNSIKQMIEQCQR